MGNKNTTYVWSEDLIINYKEKYLKCCADLNLYIYSDEYGSSQLLRKYNSAKRKLNKLYHDIKLLDDKSFLLELLNDGDECTKLYVSVHCLHFGIYKNDAVKILKSTAKNKKNSLLSFEAQGFINLYRKNGIYNY